MFFGSVTQRNVEYFFARMGLKRSQNWWNRVRLYERLFRTAIPVEFNACKKNTSTFRCVYIRNLSTPAQASLKTVTMVL